jgi:hypothetical protein
MNAAASQKRSKGILHLIATVVVPLALYYGLRALGMSVYAAQLASAVIPAVTALHGLIRKRQADGLALYMTTMLLLSLAVSLISGSVRFLLAREAWLTGVTGLWFIASIWTDHPLAYLYSRPMLERTTGPAGFSWDDLWEQLPRFRRIWRVSSTVWGVGLLADSGLRALMAYTLPVDEVPALGTALYVATSIVLILIANIYYLAMGLYHPGSRLYKPLSAPEQRSEQVVAEVR